MMLVMNTATRARINAALAADGLRLARDNEAGWTKRFEGVSIWVTDAPKPASGDTYEAQHALQAADAEAARVVAGRAQAAVVVTEPTEAVYAITVDTIDHNIAGDLGTATWFGPGTQDGWVGLPMCYIVTDNAAALELHLLDNTNVRGMERMHGWTAADAAVNAAGETESTPPEDEGYDPECFICEDCERPTYQEEGEWLVNPHDEDGGEGFYCKVCIEGWKIDDRLQVCDADDVPF